MTSSEIIDYSLKITIVGDSFVGKSSIFRRYMEDIFSTKYIHTIGTNIGKKIIKIGENNCGLHIFDTGGVPEFRSLTMSFFKSTNICVIVYDITDVSSFKSIESWYDSMSSCTIGKIQYVLIGNKFDDELHRKIEYADGKKLAEKYNMLFFECSAKNINNFHDIIELSVRLFVSKNDVNILKLNHGCFTSKVTTTSISMRNRNSNKCTIM
jgi:small GTP-binding protein